MKERGEQHPFFTLEPEVQRYLLVAAYTLTNFLEVNVPQQQNFGRTFELQHPGTPFEGIRSKHQLGLKDPSSGKK